MGANDSLSGAAGADTLDGGSGNDYLGGGTGSDKLDGGTGSDTLDGGAGNDYIYGGTGNDSLIGGTGNDTYVFGRGDGQDRISDNDTLAGNVDALVFKAGIKSADVLARRVGTSLVFSITGTTDSIAIDSFFDGTDTFDVEQIRFTDEPGVVWDVPKLRELVTVPTAASEQIWGYASNDSLSGGGGNDSLYGSSGHDTLQGDAGNDRLEGGSGNDVYRFDGAFGKDTISNVDTAAGKLDAIEFGSTFSSKTYWYSRNGANLTIQDDQAGTNSVTLENLFDEHGVKSSHINEVRFADGAIWDQAFLKKMVLTGNTNVSGFSSDDALRGRSGSDSLHGNAGNDTLDGGAGNDSLYGGTGNDTYVFGRGDGQDRISDNDTLAGNVDALVFKAGIKSADVLARRVGTSLVFSITGTTDSIAIDSFFDGTDTYDVEQIRFTDEPGVVWDVPKLRELVTVPTAASEQIWGYASNDNLSGGGGNDSLYGSSGHDTLQGDAGNDRLEGGSGNDVYRFDGAFGKDTISNVDTAAGKLDAIEFGSAFSSRTYWYNRNGANLTIQDDQAGTNSVTLENLFDEHGVRSSHINEVRFADGAIWDQAFLKKMVLTGSTWVSGFSSDDALRGRSGSDSLHGNAGNDTLDGGAGNDYLYGGTGNDTYVFGRGDGQDHISDNDTLAGNVDALVFKSGIKSTDVLARRMHRDLVLSINGTTDRVTIDNFFDGTDTYDVEQIRFTDEPGVVWDVPKLREMVTVPTAASEQIWGNASNDNLSGGGGNDSLQGDAGNDTLYGWWGHDTLLGGSGHDVLNGEQNNDLLIGETGSDTLYGADGNDSLQGGSEIDHLYGDAGADSLDGGLGDDNLYGGTGNDTYVFGRGDGQDRISDNDTLAGNVDALVFKAGIKSADVLARRMNSDLVLSVNGTTDRVTVERFFDGTDTYDVEQIRFTDEPGVVWDVPKLRELVTVPTAASEQIWGYAGNDSLSGGGGNDSLYGSSGHDTLQGDAGNDRLEGGSGNDVYRFDGAFGKDTISNVDTTAGKLDAIEFGSTFSSRTYWYNRNGANLTIQDDQAGTNSVTLENLFDEHGVRSSHINEVRFADGAVWDQAFLKNMVSTGNGLVTGFSSDDKLKGLAGNDTLQGNAGNDSLDGGTGNDSLIGGTGNDTYVFGRGDGQDRISDSDTLAGNVDTLVFKSGIKSTDVLARRMNSDLVLSVNGTTDRVTVERFFDGTDTYDVEQVRFTDEPGVVWDVPKLRELVTVPTAASEQIWGYASNDSLSGGGGNDSLYGSSGHDTLQGDAGNDRLEGGSGNDVYRFDGAFGKDTISNVDTTANKRDAIEFGSTFSSRTYWYSRNGDTLTIQDDQAGTNSVTLENLFDEHGVRSSHINEVRFADGTIWDQAFLKKMVLTGSTRVSGFSSDDALRGGGGSDSLYGNAGNDTLDGGAGNDYLYGGTGNDTLVAGMGNDALRGEAGNDTYVFTRGDGMDTVTDHDTIAGNADILQFTGAITHDQLWFSQAGSHLKISVIGTADSVTINNWASGTAHQVEKFSAGGKSLSHTQVSNLVQAMASMTPPPAGQLTLSQAQQDQLAPVLAANWA